MKKIGNLIFILISLGIFVLVYFHVDEISDYIANFLLDRRTIVMEEANKYKLDYDYLYFNNDEDFIPYSYDDLLNIFYNILNNGWDHFTFYCPRNYENCMEDAQRIASDDVLMSDINGYVHPYNTFYKIELEVSSLRDVTVNVIHKYNDEKIDAINRSIVKAYSTLNLENKTDEEKIKEVHNYIIKVSTYDKDKANGDYSPYDSSSAYGNLIEGYGVCSGYADTTSIFLNYLGIPNIRITSANHVWNLVYLNGKWLHLDITWDDVDNKKYRDNYFLITTEELYKLDKEEHTFNEKFFKEAIF